jgi:hypothetical protein
VSRSGILLLMIVGTFETPARAQTPAQRPDPLLAPPPKEAAAKWTFEIRGGFAAATTPTKGSSRLPAPGPAIAGTIGVPVPRSASSLFFGDGAAQWNGVFPGAPMQPIDALLAGPIARRSTGGAFGITVARRVFTRWSADVSIDMALQPLSLTSAAESGLKAAAVAFAQAFPPLGGGATATMGGTTSAGRELSITAGATYWLRPRGAFRTFLTGGAGAIVDSKGPVTTLTGVGQASAAFPNGLTNFANTDLVTLHATDGHVHPAAYIGGGAERGLTANTGVRFLVRVGFTPAHLATTLDASPTFSRTSPANVLVLSSPTDTIVFSTSSAIPATLSASPVRGFQAFTSSGVRVQAIVSAGYFVRF